MKTVARLVNPVVILVVAAICCAVAEPAKAAPIRLAPTADNWINSCSSGCTVNGGADAEIRVRTSWWGGATKEPKNFRSVLRFDLASLPPAIQADPGLITSATLGLYYWSAPQDDPAGHTYVVHRVTNSWDEMNSTWQARDDYQEAGPVYWDTFNAGVPAYQPGGGDFASTGYATATVPNSTDAWMTWDVTGLVREWVDGTHANLGLIVKDASEIEGNPGVGAVSYLARFRSRDYSDAGLRPYLEVVPEPATIAMVGLGTVAVTVSRRRRRR